MQVAITGKQIDIGASLQEYVRDKLTKSVHKYFERAIDAHVTFSKQAFIYHCTILVNEGTGNHVIMKADDDSDDIYAAFDGALIKIEKRLRRYKTRVKDHKKPKISALDIDEDIKGKKYIISSAVSETEENEEHAPLIIAEKTQMIEALTVSEAVMRMDLLQLPALLFKNKLNGRLNVVYYRGDGNISWVDPAEK